MGMKGRKASRPSPEAVVTTEKDRAVMERMQDELFKVWKALVKKAGSKNATTAARALIRLGPISEQLRAVTKDHARLVTNKAQTPPKGFKVTVVTGTSDEERGDMRVQMQEILDEGRAATAAAAEATAQVDELATAEVDEELVQ